MTEMDTDSRKKKTSTRIPELLEKPEVQKFIRDYYINEDKAYYVPIAMTRWRKETHYPPVEVLIGIASLLNVNLAYVLGMTDEKVPCDFSKPPVERSLDDFLAVRDMNKRDLVLALDKNYKLLHSIEEKLPLKRPYSLMKLSKALGLSVDYIMGYTNWETWEMCVRLNKPFQGIKAGTGAYLIADKNVRTAVDVEEAISRGDGTYCLLSPDGKQVIFPNGKKYSVDDDMFIGSYIAKVRPEIEK